MKLLPGPFLIPSLAVGTGALVLQAARSQDSTLIAIAVIGALGSLGAAWLAHKGKQIGEQTKAIASETRALADGRLTQMTDTVAELNAKLAASESNVAMLVAKEVSKASGDVLTRAQAVSTDVIAKAEATAATLLQRAEERASAVIAEALRVAPPPRRR